MAESTKQISQLNVLSVVALIQDFLNLAMICWSMIVTSVVVVLKWKGMNKW